VAKIIVKHGRAAGVALTSGEEITANVVSSSVDPHLTFEKFLEPSELPSDFFAGREAIQVPRVVRESESGAGCAAGVAVHAGRRAASPRGDSISPSVEYMERGYDDAKYGHYSRRPYVDMVIPSLTDPSVAPPGKHVLSCFVQYAPYKLAEERGTNKAKRLATT